MQIPNMQKLLNNNIPKHHAKALIIPLQEINKTYLKIKE